jgi:phosphate-selective porin OprO/OprP
MRRRSIAFTAAALTAAMCGSAWADEASEKALADKLQELQRRFDELSRRVGDGSNRSDDELEQRVAELEKITKKDEDGLFPYWKTGMKLDSTDGAFKLSIFGRIQNDWTFWDSEREVTDTLGQTHSATEFRRARLGAGGTVYKNVVYKFEADFANGAVNFADAFIELKDPFMGSGVNFRVGHFDEPMGLDRLTSSKYSTFIERGLQETFVPARNTGFMFLGQALENRLSYFAGAFRDANGAGDDLNNANQGEHNLTARVAGRPWVNEGGDSYVHLGGSISHRNNSNETAQLRSRPETHVGPFFVDTGSMTDIDTSDLYGLEAAAVLGSFQVVGEIFNYSTNGIDGVEDRDFGAQSIYVSYFLTGETRAYETAGARFDRIKTKKNFGADGMGAWEVALRYSTIDLDDGSIDGGELDDITFGLNWYLNPNTRIMLNVIRADREDLPSITAVVMRFGIDF